MKEFTRKRPWLAVILSFALGTGTGLTPVLQDWLADMLRDTHNQLHDERKASRGNQ